MSVLPILNRTFIWDVKANKNIGLELQFSLPRLRQIGLGESCPDGVTHSISSRVDTKMVRIGTFCSNGTVSRIKMQEGVKMALALPWFHNRKVSGFSITNQLSIKRELAMPSPLFAEVEAYKITLALHQKWSDVGNCVIPSEYLKGSPTLL